MSNARTTSGGIGFPGLLALIFITLKLTGVITWSWLWVLAPIWISLIIWSVVMIAALITGIIFASIQKR